MTKPALGLVAIGAAFVVGFTVLFWLAARESDDCRARGGHMERTGVVIITTGKTTTVTPSYSCIGARP